MQYQIFKEDTGEIVAWIDTEKEKAICLAGYDVKGGEELVAQDIGIDND